ncbi:sterol desaturase family protein [Bacteriovorax sp. Seq25_V]|uniref:sterol desaturase family protein n=1 Tax=Bacteriovorax sp. Seq25_V TaxID=1201288 RepID=UPI00038A3FC5|nr:sterol desaturase family protein [Bacteriovorax sp. Seq25_V]EQC47978.1 fatty acid hydroxylase family protein [Bacteriovorax sp. Seq25_V]
MVKVFNLYFKHPLIWVYLILSLIMLIYLASKNLLLPYSYLFLILIIAPFYEWLLHKYVLHGRALNESEAKQKYMDRLHRDHHRYPKKVDLLFAPLSAGLSIPIQFFILGCLVTQNIDIGIYLAFVSLTYYLFYEWIHLAHHVDSYYPKTGWGKALKNSHLLHHYKNENYWWGVTSNFGDKVLGTYPLSNEVAKSTTVKEI